MVYLRVEKTVTLPKLSCTNAEDLGKVAAFSTSNILETALHQFHHGTVLFYTTQTCICNDKSLEIRIIKIRLPNCLKFREDFHTRAFPLLLTK